MFEKLELGYKLPRTSKTFISEYHLGEETIARVLGSSMHVFLLDIPRLEFGAIIPKGDYVTVCLLGKNIDKSLVGAFLDSPAVKKCFPTSWQSDRGSCQCWPSINVRAAVKPFADRVVFIGDCGVTRLYKDGIGAAYRTAKAAATTAIFQGISAASFRNYYWPVCNRIIADNTLGDLSFGAVRKIRKMRVARCAMLRMSSAEQKREPHRRGMSMVLWDMFTGSAPYKDIFLRILSPGFMSHFLWNVVASIPALDRFAEVRGNRNEQRRVR